MKKVLFMLTSMNIGGVEKSLLSLLSVMPRDKFDITILLLEKKGGFLRLLPDWVKVEEVSWYSTIKPLILQPPQQILKEYSKKGQYIKGFDYLCTYLLSTYLNNRYLFYKQILKRVSNHAKEYDIAISYQGPTDIIDFYVGNKVTATKKISWVHFDVSNHEINVELYEKLYKKFNNIFIVSNEAKKQLLNKMPNVSTKTIVFPNIVSGEIIRKMAKEKRNFDKEYTGLRIVSVGRLSKEKGQDIAIKVLSKLRKNGYEVRWYCVGEGKFRKECEKFIEEYNLTNDFILLGSTTNPYPLIARCDIYVQPSRHEGFCLSLAEAKYLNKPIVTTNFIGASEQIIDGFNGRIAEISVNDLYGKIKSILDDPDQQEALKRNLSTMEMDTTAEVNKLLQHVT